MTSSPAVFIGLGSNVGEREVILARARQALAQSGLALEAASALYHTEPVGGPPQDWFLNQVVGGRTALRPEELMRVCLDVERAEGRVRTVPNAPRTLDLDLLLYGAEVRDTPELTLPHPRLHERLFVLVPLNEIAPGLLHPRLGKTIDELRRLCPDRSRVVPWQPVARPR